MKGIQGIVRGQIPGAGHLSQQARLQEGLPIGLTEPEASHASGVVSRNRRRLLRGDRGQAVLIDLSRFLLPPRYCEDISQRCIDRNRLLPPLLLLRVSRPRSEEHTSELQSPC